MNKDDASAVEYVEYCKKKFKSPVILYCTSAVEHIFKSALKKVEDVEIVTRETPREWDVVKKG